MAKFLFAYHGGGDMPSDPAEMEKEMTLWREWFGAIGQHVVDGGNPVGQSHTVSGGGVVDNGGSNPVSGYGIFEAANMDEASEIAKGCPVIAGGGTVEVAEIIDVGE